MALAVANCTLNTTVDTFISKTNASGSLESTRSKQAHSTKISYTIGSGANQVNQVFSDVRSLAASGTETLDLTDGTLTNHMGEGCVFARIKAIVIELLTTTSSSSIEVGGAANPFLGPLSSGTYEVRNGGDAVFKCPDATGWVVTATTADELLITNNDGTNAATYRITILGATS